MRDGPYLFLDIDGVLNSHNYARRLGKGGILGIDPEAVKHLQRVVDETDCQIVLSSTWRLGPPGTLSNVRGKLVAAGMRSPCPLIDRTPDLSYAPNEKGQMIHRGARRGEEVKHWLDAFGYDGPYVCIDDDSDFLDGQPLVKTTFAEGMTAAHADQCIAILKGSPTTVGAKPE